MADERHLTLLKSGVRIWNAWRFANREIVPSLSQANLEGMNLNEAYLQDANLSFCKFAMADLSEANLTRANLQEADLYKANLTGADLWMATLADANLLETNLTNCLMGQSNLCNVDLSNAVGLETIRHGGPSTIGIDTIYKSKNKIPEIFLRRAGIPDNFIVYGRSLVGAALEYYSCFISHSGFDQEFAERIYTDLQAKGVRCWYFPEDAQWGKSVWGEIDNSIKIYDKLVIICSSNSLKSGPVNREIERALQREDLEHRHILFPIRIDDYLFKIWDHPRKADILSKVVGDFSHWKNHDSYKKSFDRLQQVLKQA
jgi:hypothetical protein